MKNPTRTIYSQLNWISFGNTIIRKSSIEEFYVSGSKNFIRLTSGASHEFSSKEMEDLLDKLGVITEFPK